MVCRGRVRWRGSGACVFLQCAFVGAHRGYDCRSFSGRERGQHLGPGGGAAGKPLCDRGRVARCDRDDSAPPVGVVLFARQDAVAGQVTDHEADRRPIVRCSVRLDLIPGLSADRLRKPPRLPQHQAEITGRCGFMFPVTLPEVRNRGLWPSFCQSSNRRQFTGSSLQFRLVAGRLIKVIWVLDSRGFTGHLGLVPVGGSRERAFSRRTPCRF
jgi:hypothetical protein